MCGRQTGTEAHDEVNSVLTDLEASGRVTYREFADELPALAWLGSRPPIRDRIHASPTTSEPVEVLLSRTREMLPVVAARHSTVTGTLRVFNRAWDSDGVVDVLPADSGADGLLVYLVGSKIPRIDPKTSDGRPTVAVRPQNDEELIHAALELAAVRAVLQDENIVGDDWVARQEKTGRTRGRSAHQVRRCVRGSGRISLDGAKWWLLTTEDGKPSSCPRRLR